MRLQTYSVLVVLSFLGGCGGATKTATMDDLYTRELRLPDGVKLRAEVATKPFEMARGLMFRDVLPEDRAMLFVYGQSGQYPVFTYQVRIPIDAIWLDQNRIINEVVPDIPPCKSTSARQCPQYGGTFRSLYVIELKAGTAAKHRLKAGDRLDF
jgi:uncharacterized protein